MKRAGSQNQFGLRSRKKALREDAGKGSLAARLAPGAICRQQDGMVFPPVAKVTYGPPPPLPPPLQLRRPPCGCTALELNSQRAHKRTGNRITRIVTRTEKFIRRVRVYRPSARDAYTRPANPGPRTVANGHAEFAIQRMPRIPRFFARL